MIVAVTSQSQLLKRLTHVFFSERTMLMNFLGALELLRALKKFYPKTSRTAPKMALFDAEKEGYMIWINEDSLKSNYLCFMKEIVETRHLSIRRHDGYLVMHSS